jgi:hypothetical protein
MEGVQPPGRRLYRRGMLRTRLLTRRRRILP